MTDPRYENYHKSLKLRFSRNKHGVPLTEKTSNSQRNSYVVQGKRKMRRWKQHCDRVEKCSITQAVFQARRIGFEVRYASTSQHKVEKIISIAKLIKDGRLHLIWPQKEILNIVTNAPPELVKRMIEKRNKRVGPFKIIYAYPEGKGQMLLTELMIKSNY